MSKQIPLRVSIPAELQLRVMTQRELAERLERPQNSIRFAIRELCKLHVVHIAGKYQRGKARSEWLWGPA